MLRSLKAYSNFKLMKKIAAIGASMLLGITIYGQSKETDSFFLKKGTGVMVSYIIKRSYDDSGNLINERKFATDTYKELSSIFKGRFKRFNKKGRHNN